MSLMGVVMMTGIAVSDSILIVEFVGTLRKQGTELKLALAEACKVRLRPILMTTMATILGLIPWHWLLSSRKRTIRAAGPGHPGRTYRLRVSHRFLVPTAYPAYPSQEERSLELHDTDELSNT